MNICIGIVSYLPELNKSVRLGKLNSLLKQCNNIFNLPIIIIALNWGDIMPVEVDSLMTIHKYKNRLGITGARRALRSAFLSSEYDYMIMLDDDIFLLGTFEHYLELIESNPDGFCKFKDMTLQLFAISKSLYSLIDFPYMDPVNGQFLEDMWLIMALEKKHKDKELIFLRYGCDAVGNAVDDRDSTWYHGLFSKREMGNNTRAMILEL